jgi:hypothetical protein
MYWCALHILFDPSRIHASSSSSSFPTLMMMDPTSISTNAKSASAAISNPSLPPESLAFVTESELDGFNTTTATLPSNLTTQYY